ncbi:DUF2599 domain-containing protein [Nocardiopsis valliformis]|uniref:DUF2599 domain-containing protein n=1 Tax=Nocardiopsis valliformis TaxID=239974 RepID=UPI00034AD396|nr:DUF2599 domain-containing protein [Nocardiopsis valliformis]
MKAVTENGQSVIPIEIEEPISVDGYGDHHVSIRLPFPESTEPAEILDDGTAVFDHGNGAQTVPLLKTDGSVQITTIIEDSSAPTGYEYDLSAVGLDRIEEQDDGILVLLDPDGAYLASIAPAWAKDAHGSPVSTRYEIDGTKIVQVVDHPGEVFAYPVVADPWLGIDLFSWTSYTTERSQLRVNARKSAYGQGIPMPGTGQAIFLSAGWNELKAKRPRVTEKKTLRQQYDCHVAGGFFNIAGDWNLEKRRPTRTRSWTYGVARHRCNWTTASGNK